MQTALLIIHLILALLIVVLVLLQKSEGGALGIGGGGDGLASRLVPSNPLVKATTILGITFFLSSIGLTLLSQYEKSSSSLGIAPSSTEPLSVPKPKGAGK